jgi:hypothetical protein
VIQGKMRAAALAGLAMGAASAAPILGALNCACCSLVLLGGVLASHLYVKNLPPSPQPQWGDAAVVGLLAGLIGAAVQAVLSIPMMFMGFGMDTWNTIQDALSGADVPPEIRNLFATFGSGTFAIGAILLTFVFNLFLYGLFSTLGALIGVAMFQRKQPPAMVPPPPPPPLPPGAY